MDTLNTSSESILSRTIIQFVGPFKQRATNNSPGDFWLTLPIFATECAERFNFYGFTALLTLYFQQHLHYGTQQAAANFNYFQALCYCTPLLGSWFADQYLGKYRTIVYFTLIYLSGQLLLPLSSLLQEEVTWTKLLTFLSLFLIALGTGGIKPCVSAFGAEQVEWRHKVRLQCTAVSLERNALSTSQLSKDFVDPLLQMNDNFNDDMVEEQVSNGYPIDASHTSVEDRLNTTIYFARFYLCINMGAIAGQLICPWTKQVFGWSGAYFVSASVLLLSLVTFLNGMRFTGYVHIQKESSPTLLHHIRHTVVSFSSIFFHRNDQNNQLYRTTRAIEEWRCILRISLLLSPIAIFWMCWSQQGATWIQQLSLMEMPRIFDIQMNPAQWTAWNPLSKWLYIVINHFQSFFLL
ncbi:proton-dependent oligopeptide transporter, POT family [Galdieria sulphuraria]|uniref:Proton-dependent oligopeptide transporter, POT family n=1 Tax=Galdieria sulphuraria TaxID=130081 RepID=M2X7H5_GALSU|nr:proton-dependent oligopeptide transporter, POT family [Galdieria sulphuraria]EME32475.1 proton-dependent oligopeptide transporter, POT family [Galdieria sulphuraria]|eukprot:XP_005708995.1 proton-dependent oligopeptide transporter, POT family [Galdieria sulphuraria]